MFSHPFLSNGPAFLQTLRFSIESYWAIGLIPFGFGLLLWYYLNIYRRYCSRPLWRERPFRMNHPIPLTGIPDLVWQEKNGTLTIHDLKNRSTPRIFDSDILQLSLYKLLVETSTRRSVNPYGVIRVRTTNRPDRLLRVPLLTTAQLIDRYEHYCALLNGQIPPQPCTNRRYCQSCGFYGKECNPTL